jgi:F420H(2)-dependent quinone reductase
MEDGPNIVIVASLGGSAKDPQWYGNLVANPDTHIQIGNQRKPVRASTADAEERARLWPQLVELYADFDRYQSWTEREIPIVVLRPR